MSVINQQHERIISAIEVYSKKTNAPIDEILFVDMVRDILSYARTKKIDPKEVCLQADNNDSQIISPL